jgi:excisionase family DNA binding protein
MDPITTTIEGAKKATGLGTTTLYRLINEGKLETVKVGRRTLVRTQSLRVLLGIEE